MKDEPPVNPLTRLTGQHGAGLPDLALYAFGGFGALMFVIGALTVWSDPVGFVMMAIGCLFAAIGWFARRLFAPPPGMKSVPVDTYRAGSKSVTTLINVPEDATEADIEAARADWREARMSERPGAADGRIPALAQSNRGNVAFGAWFGTAVAAIFLIAAWLIDETIPWIAAIGVAAYASLFWFVLLFWRIRARKFGEAVCILDTTAVAPGARLSGVVETGADRRSLKDGTFTVLLSCVDKWESTEWRGSESYTRQNRKTRWEHEKTIRASGERNLTVRFAFDLPADLPGSTFADRNEGVFWYLELRAAARGLDYQNRFPLPVMEDA